MRSRAFAGVSVLIVSLAVCSAQLAGCGGGEEGGAAEVSPELPGRAVLGQEWFGAYCAQCHGSDARGTGPMADSLTPQPADLTGIAERAGGVFDSDAVTAYIDGRRRVGAHGTSEMPAWGAGLPDRFGRPDRQEPRLSPDAVALIVEYLRGIQTEQRAGVQPPSADRYGANTRMPMSTAPEELISTAPAATSLACPTSAFSSADVASPRHSSAVFNASAVHTATTAITIKAQSVAPNPSTRAATPTASVAAA